IANRPRKTAEPGRVALCAADSEPRRARSYGPCASIGSDFRDRRWWQRQAGCVLHRGGFGPRSIPTAGFERNREASSLTAAGLHSSRALAILRSLLAWIEPLQIRIGLFVTCLVDLFRPRVGLAAVKLLEDAGCLVEAPRAQTCCGQPAYNSGDRKTAAAIARQVVDLFEGFNYVVAPSGSCAGMLRVHFPTLLADDAAYRDRAASLAAKSYELVAFLVDVLKQQRVAARFDGNVTYHDSCSGLRELGIKDQPRRLLASIEGLALRE